MENDSGDIVSYYNEFYDSTDFDYYPPEFTARVLKTLLRKCRVPSGARVLDVGCGTGFYSSVLHAMGFQVTAIDISSTAIAKAVERHPGIRFEVADATALPFGSGQFDFVFALGVSVANTRDLDQIHAFINHLLTVLDRGGCVALLGGSDLGGGQSRTSSWIYHTWKDLKRFIPGGNTIATGPLLSHFRLMHTAPALSLNRFTTFLLRYLGGSLVRKTIFLFRNPD